MNTKQSVYMCIDLKSFYASVECADLGLDPFTTPLVVADASRGKGAITLAISPALKNMGVKNRSTAYRVSHRETSYEAIYGRICFYLWGYFTLCFP